ncbi:G-protein coupled receptor dmsr-1-like [Diprion similis]|uniref:G-protein coupled receptor dmsr-1-like n=1 Tax=Diprion similis TaxID=362088 RepID=UPI001EF8603B|nr:G-protein coupled receptor dmsr-1-like [Diprion similis]
MNFTNETAEFEEEGGFSCSLNGTLDAFHTTYIQIHGYASLLVCLFGSVANTLNIAVLTRREMNSPTNAILTGLAVADLLVMLEYIPYATHMYLLHRPRREQFTYPWSFFVLFHSNFAQVFHTISIWLTVTLAIWRYIAVAFPQKNRELCSINRTMLAIAGAYVICPIICVPLYLTFSLESRTVLIDGSGNTLDLNQTNHSLPEDAVNTTLYFVNYSQTAIAYPFLRIMNLWIYGAVIKIIPCIALTILSLQLILALVEAKKRRQKLTSAALVKTVNKSTDANDGKKTRKKPSRHMDKERQTDRTTRMLLAVLLLFLITEFPQGVMGLLSVMLGARFFDTCYVKLGEVMDILALINSAINFILYCAMSRQFRTTFNQLFGRSKLFGRWMPIPQHGENNGNTGTNHTVTQVTQV